ncbi:MAG: lamin tail domain-containing protein [Polyangiales bacterium]
MRTPARVLIASWLAASAGCSVFEPPIDSTMQPGPVEGADAQVDAQADAQADSDATVVDTGLPPAVDADVDAFVPDVGVEDAGSDAGPPAPSCKLANFDPMDMCTGPIVINEVDGSGDDFVEIYNRGDVAVNIGGWLIADDSGGSPDVPEGAVFPQGTILEPKRHVYLWANLQPEPGGNPGLLFNACIPSSPPPCLHTEWGVSGQGERLYLLNSALELVCAVSYPGQIFANEAFGRTPDGSDTLCPTNPTPGAINVVSSVR